MRQYGTAKAAEAANAVPFFAANAPMQMLRCECSDVNAPNDYMRSNAGHNHLKINKGGGTLYKENVPPPDSIQFCQVRNRTLAARQVFSRRKAYLSGSIRPKLPSFLA